MTKRCSSHECIDYSEAITSGSTSKSQNEEYHTDSHFKSLIRNNGLKLNPFMVKSLNILGITIGILTVEPGLIDSHITLQSTEKNWKISSKMHSKNKGAHYHHLFSLYQWKALIAVISQEREVNGL